MVFVRKGNVVDEADISSFVVVGRGLVVMFSYIFVFVLSGFFVLLVSEFRVFVEGFSFIVFTLFLGLVKF